MAEPDNTNRLSPELVAAARAAGLDKVLERFPDDIADAARSAAADLADLPPIDGASEPWPPMRIRTPR